MFSRSKLAFLHFALCRLANSGQTLLGPGISGRKRLEKKPQGHLVYLRGASRERIFLLNPLLVHEALARNADTQSSSEYGGGLSVRHSAGLLSAFRREKLLGLLPAMTSAAERIRDPGLAAGALQAKCQRGEGQ
ncbi:MAG: hypothetical protein K0Q60_3098 [Microvirga sp.]|nr:hypothetical protein [Microvirga sp.]